MMRAGRLGHGIFALGYCAIGAVAALLLAVFRPETDAVVIILAAGQIILSGGLIHEVVVRRYQQRKLTERMQRMRQAYEDLVDLILKTRTGTPAPAPAPPALSPAPAEPAPEITPAPLPTEPPAPAPRRSPRVPRPADPPLPAPTPAPTPKPSQVDDAKIAAILREALANRRVEAFLQPIVTIPGRKALGFEVLARVRLPDGTLMMPERYLDVATQEGLLPAHDRLVLTRTTQLIRDTDRHHHAVTFFCNIGLATLGDSNFLSEYLGGGGDRHGVKDKLVFELSQRALTAEAANPVSVISEMAEIGFQFSMDQTDTLAIALVPLIERGIRFVKLPCTLICQPEQRKALADLQQQASSQPVALIAEKIESETQLQEVMRLEFPCGQGFLLSEPRPSRRQVI